MVESSINTNLERNCAPIPLLQAVTFSIGSILSSITFRMLLTQENAAILEWFLDSLVIVAGYVIKSPSSVL